MAANYHSLASGSLTQNWTDSGMLTVNDDWTNVASITGHLGDIDPGSPTDVNPTTLTGAEVGALDVIANQANPNTLTSGGVAEFSIADPTVALQGSGTADAPSLVLYLDATGRQNVRLQFNARDIDGSADNAVQQLGVQFRVGGSGAWTNVGGGYVADATSGPSLATQVTPVDVTLPAAANNQAQVQVRILTTNATGSDEWVGVDDIVVSSEPGAGGGGDTTAPTLQSSTPADNATNVATGADITLTFDETVQAGDGFIIVTDGGGDTRTITVGGAADPDGSVTFNGNTVTVDLAGDLANATGYDVMISPGAIEDAAGNDFAGLNINSLDFTTVPAATPLAISTIQGTGHSSGFIGQLVITQGTVTAVDTNGFYLQDAAGDGNAATSDGIFVFTGSAPTVSVGDAASVTGQVSEFFPGTGRGFLSVTQIDARPAMGGNVVDLGAGAAVAATVIGGPGGLLPPTEDLLAGGLFFEGLEGMLVTLTNPVAVGPTNNFGEIFAVVDNDADPANGLNATGLTSRGTVVVDGGDPVLGFTNTTNGDFNPERIQIDDDSGLLPGFVTPEVDAGAVLQSVTGVMSYNFANYEVLATQAYAVAQASPLVKETGTLQGTADRLLVASYNAENLDPNDAASRFTTIADEIINRLNTPDIIALQEIQDNDGAVGGAAGSTVTAANVTLQAMVDAIAAAGGPQYAFLDNPFIGDDTNGGEPGGNIRTAFLYRTDRVDFVDGSLATVGADGSAITDPTGNGGQQTDDANPFFGSRPPLVATFEFNGQDVTIVNNHFSSKGGSGALLGSEQPPFDASEVQRAAQAQAVNNFVDGLLAQDAQAKVIVAGDLNEFPFEEPIGIVKGTGALANYNVPPSGPFDATGTFVPGGTAVLNDLLDLLPAGEQYDYVFEGNAQTLDHVLVSNGLIGTAQFDVVRINAEFADQTSDHDPLLASFEISGSFTLQLLHMSDGEAGLLAPDTAPIMGALIDRFDDQYANTLILSGGDNFLPGPFLVAGADPALNAVIGATALARPDIAIHNAFGVEASAIGNHEWDLGSAVFRDAYAPSGAWVGAQFPHLSANLDFSKDSSVNPTVVAGGQEASSIKGKVAPSAVVTEGGEKIGLVGATTQVLERISSPTGTEVQGFPKAGEPGDNQEFDDMVLLAQQLQPVIDGLIAQGVNKIIVMSHLQNLNNEKALAPLLHGVDIILSAGSHTRAGDANDVPAAFPGHDANFADTYPVVTSNADGDPTLIVVTDSEYTYLGRLVVEFDGEGVIDLSSLDATINGAYASTQANLEAAYGAEIDEAFAEGSKGDKVRDITQVVDGIIQAKDGVVFGFTDVYLEGDRTFGRFQETNLGNLSADANGHAAAGALGEDAFIVSLKNGGGIRASIGSIDPPTGDKIPPIANPDAGKGNGGVSQLDIENALRFDNKLMVFDTTPAGLLAILNHGAGLNPGNGGYPQVGGVRFSYDPDLPAGSRIQSVALIDEDDRVVAKVVENGVVLDEAPDLISVVTLNFTANGGDGYPVKQNAENFRFLLTDGTLSGPIDEALNFTSPAVVPANALGEQKAFADFMTEFHATPETAYDEADTPASADTRIQNLNLRDDGVFDSAPIIGDDTDNLLVGTAVDDLIEGGEGDDHIEGLGGDDLIKGGDDDDTILAGAGDDTVHGEHEDDTIFGGEGNDQLFGDEGDDKLNGEADNDYLVGGKGDDLVNGGSGNDVLAAILHPNKTDGVDTYDGGEGIDTLDFGGSTSAIVLNLGTGKMGSDTIKNLENVFGGEGDDQITGDGKANELRGGAGNDKLNGGSGDDVLIGGLGSDEHTGGSGADKFVFDHFDGLSDTIKDFAVTGSQRDTLVLSDGLFQNFGGDDPFDLIGGGFLRVNNAAGNGSQVQVDLNGGGDSWQTLAQLNVTITNGVLADHTVVVQDEIV